MNVAKLLLLLLLIIHPLLYAQDFKQCNIHNTTTKDGERLRYKVYYTVAGIYVAAGEAVFSNSLESLDQQKVFHVRGAGHTYKNYDWIYHVNDLYESYIDTSTMLPLRFARRIDETGNHQAEQVSFDHNKRQAVSKKKVVKTPECVQDVLSAIYYARNINFNKYKINDCIPFSMYLDDEVHDLYIRYLGKEKLTTRHGSYQVIKFRPKLIEGTLFRGGEGMTVYVTDDAKKIPVYIETPILVGKVKVYLIK